MQHLLLSYIRAMAAVCDAQFTAKRLRGCVWNPTVTAPVSGCTGELTLAVLMRSGEQGCLDMLKDPHVRRLLAAGGLSTERMRRRECVNLDEQCKR